MNKFLTVCFKCKHLDLIKTLYQQTFNITSVDGFSQICMIANAVFVSVCLSFLPSLLSLHHSIILCYAVILCQCLCLYRPSPPPPLSPSLHHSVLCSHTLSVSVSVSSLPVTSSLSITPSHCVTRS